MDYTNDTQYTDAVAAEEDFSAEAQQAESLLDFFPEKAGLPTDAVAEAKISERFPAFKLQALTEFETDQLEKDCTTVKIKKGRQVKNFDQNKYLKKLVIRSVKHPNFNNSELQQKYNVMGAESLVSAMFTPGEYSKLAAAVSEINGYEPLEAEEIEEQVKN